MHIVINLHNRSFLEHAADQKKLPICASDTGQTKEMGQFRANMHVGVLPSADNQISLELAEEERWPASSEFDIYRCALQLEVSFNSGRLCAIFLLEVCKFEFRKTLVYSSNYPLTYHFFLGKYTCFFLGSFFTAKKTVASDHFPSN